MLREKKLSVEDFLVQSKTLVPSVCGHGCGCGSGGFFRFCRNFSGIQDTDANEIVLQLAISTAQVTFFFMVVIKTTRTHLKIYAIIIKIYFAFTLNYKSSSCNSLLR